MFKTKCPHCRVKLGDYLYADFCLYCRRELKHNRTALLPARPVTAIRRRSFPMRVFLGVVRLIES
jgi:hypothetical protein